MGYLTDKMSEFCRKKNREVDDLKKERDSEKAQKVQAMKELADLVKLNEVKEQKLLQKFCLVLNEKKSKIAELKSILLALEGENAINNQVPKEVNQMY